MEKESGIIMINNDGTRQSQDNSRLKSTVDKDGNPTFTKVDVEIFQKLLSAFSPAFRGAGNWMNATNSLSGIIQEIAEPKKEKTVQIPYALPDQTPQTPKVPYALPRQTSTKPNEPRVIKQVAPPPLPNDLIHQDKVIPERINSDSMSDVNFMKGVSVFFND